MALRGRAVAWQRAWTALLFLQLFWPTQSYTATPGPRKLLEMGVNGGIPCAACTVLLSLTEQIAEVNNGTVTEVLETICLHVGSKYQSYCRLAFDVFGPTIIEMLAEKAEADSVCRALNLCYQESGQNECLLYPNRRHHLNEKSTEHHKQLYYLRLQKFGIQEPSKISFCDIPGVSILCSIYNEAFSLHLPGEDIDKDGFSLLEALRGSSWRGKDCDDTRQDIHSGTIPVDGDTYHDSNCNGIFGKHAGTNTSYEDAWCQNSGQLGVIAIGDSAGAHFHLPEEWFNPLLFTEASLNDIGFIVSNELDWPQLSFITGYMNTTWPVVHGLTDSIYLKMRERNRCNHRDFQNLAVNGADSFNVQGYMETLSRNQTTDTPALVFLELIGNDVCNNNPDTVAHMTTPQQMSANMLAILKKLDSRLPNGSHVLLIGLADGDFLYQFLHNRTHPAGSFRQDLTYATVYDWLSCLQITPCYGWMNSNGTTRSQTTQRANELNDAIKVVAAQYRYSFRNMEVNYLDNPLTPILYEWLKEHGPDSGWQLIEPVDGFHPNQVANFLVAQYIWNYLEDNLPHYIGAQNPNNEKIIAMFGDQGGH